MRSHDIRKYFWSTDRSWCKDNKCHCKCHEPCINEAIEHMEKQISYLKRKIQFIIDYDGDAKKARLYEWQRRCKKSHSKYELDWLK